ncbi:MULTISPECIES: CxxH/CxxC protein [Bacillaceae]|uniref:CxxH/CxxC protein n=1 Tax=Bacillaceae TaxID=186817 RepID=UPI0012E153B8|nr:MULTISPECIES: CxxH/CxxC protein [Bacillaceae]
MRIFSCETHINQALDMFVAEQKTFPMLEQLADEEKLSTKCTYCDVAAVYIVADEK